jgi:hypothetical protein
LERSRATIEEKHVVDALRELHTRCDDPTVNLRPLFAEIRSALNLLQTRMEKKFAQNIEAQPRSMAVTNLNDETRSNPP